MPKNKNIVYRDHVPKQTNKTKQTNPKNKILRAERKKFTTRFFFSRERLFSSSLFCTFLFPVSFLRSAVSPPSKRIGRGAGGGDKETAGFDFGGSAGVSQIKKREREQKRRFVRAESLTSFFFFSFSLWTLSGRRSAVSLIALRPGLILYITGTIDFNQQFKYYHGQK